MKDDTDIHSLVGICPRRLAEMEDKAAAFDAMKPHLGEIKVLVGRALFFAKAKHKVEDIEFLAAALDAVVTALAVGH